MRVLRHGRRPARRAARAFAVLGIAVVLGGEGASYALAPSPHRGMQPGSAPRSAWTRAMPPAGLRGVVIHGVTCNGQSCLAIGQRCRTQSCAGFTTQVAIASSNHGRTWTRAGVPPDFEFAYQATTCVSAARCLAGGTIDPGTSKPTAGFAVTGALGRTWSATPIKGLGTLITTTCANAFFCYAVGYASPKVSQVAFGQIATTRTGGASWTVHAFSTTGIVNGITCTSPGACTAFGTSTDGGNSILLHTADAGATWSSRVVPAKLGVLRWLTCPAVAFCVATSNRAMSNLKSIDVTHNGGATWTTRSIGTMNVLYAASCASTSTCEFVGQTQGSDPLTATTVDHGATWPLRPVTTFGHGRLWSISCSAKNHCVAVGQWWTHTPTDGGPLLLSG